LHVFSLPTNTEDKRPANSKASFVDIGKQKVFLKEQADIFDILWSIRAI